MQFSDRLKEARERTGYSQKALATELYISQQAYAKYESGTASPNPETLKRISEVLEVSTDYLLGRTDDSSVTKKPLTELDEELDSNVLVIRGRDGRYIRKVLTDDEIDSFETLFKNLPDVPDDI